MFAPTLCYELNFPRTPRIRWRFLMRRVFENVRINCRFSFVQKRIILCVCKWCVGMFSKPNCPLPGYQDTIRPFGFNFASEEENVLHECQGCITLSSNGEFTETDGSVVLHQRTRNLFVACLRKKIYLELCVLKTEITRERDILSVRKQKLLYIAAIPLQCTFP